MTFDKFELFEVLGDIETYLGYLKGNELALDYLKRALAETSGTDTPTGAHETRVFLDEGYRFPCPEGRFKVKPNRAPFSFKVWYYPDNGDTPDQRQPAGFIDELQAGADEAWRDGAVWAQGIAHYAGSICAQFAEPDAQALADAVIDLKRDVVDELEIPAHRDWANIEGLLAAWTGQAKAQFDPFYRNYTSALTQYGAFSIDVYKGMAAATRIIAQTQNGALRFVRSIRDGLRDQLDEWVDLGNQPEDPPKTPAWVADVTQLGKDVYGLLGHVPVVSVVKDQVDKTVSIHQSVKAIALDLGADPPEKSQPFDAQSADEIHSALTDTLHTDYLIAFQHAMDAKYHLPPSRDPDKAGEVPFEAKAVLDDLRRLKDREDWYLPDVKARSLYGRGSGYHF